MEALCFFKTLSETLVGNLRLISEIVKSCLDKKKKNKLNDDFCIYYQYIQGNIDKHYIWCVHYVIVSAYHSRYSATFCEQLLYSGLGYILYSKSQCIFLHSACRSTEYVSAGERTGQSATCSLAC